MMHHMPTPQRQVVPAKMAEETSPETQVLIYRLRTGGSARFGDGEGDENAR